MSGAVAIVIRAGRGMFKSIARCAHVGVDRCENDTGVNGKLHISGVVDVQSMFGGERHHRLDVINRRWRFDDDIERAEPLIDGDQISDGRDGLGAG